MTAFVRLALAALALLVAAVTFQNLGRPLANPDEGRYSEISREMAVDGDWITPRLNGLKYFEKPPLQYWATALSFRLFGLSEWSARLYVLLCALGAVAIAAYTAARLGSRDEALGTVLALVASPYFMALSGTVTLDMGLTLWLTATVCAWLVAEAPRTRPEARRRWMLAAWAAMALAVLSKGLVGIVFPVAMIGLYCLARRDFSPLARMQWGYGLALFLAIAAPWFVAVSLANPEFAEFFFVHEHFTRFLTTEHRRTEPWWYFLPIVLLGFLPWAFALPAAVSHGWGVTSRQGAGLAPAILFSLFLVAFFSASGSKLPSYVLPAFPALALVLGRWLAHAPERKIAAWMAPSILLALAGTWAATRMVGRAREDWTRLLYAQVQPWLVASAVILAAGVMLAALLLWRRHRWAGITVAALGVVAALGTALQAFEAFSPRQSGKIVGERMRELARPGTRIYSVELYDQSAVFYLGRTVTLVKFRDELDLGLKAEPGKGIPTLEEFAADWARPGDALAIMQPGLFQHFSALGLPMQRVHEDPRRILVRKP